YPKGIRLAEALFYAAEAEEKLGRKKAAADKRRQILVEHPLSPWADKVKIPKLELTASERIARGHVYFDAMRNELAAADFAAALRDRTPERPRRADAASPLAQPVFKGRQPPRAAPLFDAPTPACEHLPSTDLLVRSLYQGGRSWGAAAEPQ